MADGPRPRLAVAADASPHSVRLHSCLAGVFADQVELVDLAEVAAKGSTGIDVAVVLAARFEAAALRDVLLAGLPPRRLVAAFERLEELEATALSELGVRAVVAARVDEAQEHLVSHVRGALTSADGAAPPARVEEVLGQLALQPVGALHGLVFKRRLDAVGLTGVEGAGLDASVVRAGGVPGRELEVGGLAGAGVRVLHATAPGLARLAPGGRALFTQELLALALAEGGSGPDVVERFLGHAVARLASDESYAPNLLVFSPGPGSLRFLLTEGADLWITSRRRIPRVCAVPATGLVIRGRTVPGPLVARGFTLAPGDTIALLPSAAPAPPGPAGQDLRRRRREDALLADVESSGPPSRLAHDVDAGEVPAPGVVVRVPGEGAARHPGERAG